MTANAGRGFVLSRVYRGLNRSTFVLITNCDLATWDARALLEEYKDQGRCGRHFHFLQDPLFVIALFLKKPEWLEALGYVLCAL